MTLTLPLSEGTVYYLRVRPATTDYTDTGTVTWTTQVRPSLSLLIVLADDVDTTPGWLTTTVTNGGPQDPVDFWIDDGLTVLTGLLDESGQLLETAVPLIPLAVGTHTVHAATSALSGSATFVVGDEVLYPDAIDTDDAPELP